ncbi:unnamed protein product [Brassica rapa subsp. narinosa]
MIGRELQCAVMIYTYDVMFNCLFLICSPNVFLGPLSMAFLLQSQGRRAKRSTEIRVLDYGVTFLNNKDEG